MTVTVDLSDAAIKALDAKTGDDAWPVCAWRLP